MGTRDEMGGPLGVVRPGSPLRPPEVERHHVPGGGSRAVQVMPGDVIELVDIQGGQWAELVAFDADGRSDAGVIGAKITGPAGGASDLGVRLAASRSGQAVLAQLRRAGCDLDTAGALRLFGPDNAAGAGVRFCVQAPAWLLAMAPGAPMRPEAQDVATDLYLYVHRATAAARPLFTAPDPLGDPLTDRLIQPGQAFVYEVPKGAYVQILDVQGRECSDFQAFSKHSIDAGLVREIDPTATRSMTGSLYPMPGLHAKYWNTDLDPLVEIVQDTCGRHDTFGLACTARYYDDAGYPGHVNCTDNINAALAPYGVAARGGWPAINFFFNTQLDAAHAIETDEPWSRPGDFVLLRALTDLVCVSTACPDDIDPANGWHPTEIAVRTYQTTERVPRSIGWRKTPEDDVQQTKDTGFHSCFARHTRDFVEYSGYWLANTFPSVGTLGEYWACRDKAAIMDLSPLRKYEVTGPDAEALMQLCATRNMAKLAVGQVVYTAICADHGGMIDDGTIFRLGDHAFRWIGGNDDSGLWLREMAAKHKLNARVRESTDQLHNVAVQGRLSRDILADVFWTPPTQPTVAELGWFRFTIARVGGFDGIPVVISRTGYTGELGYEVFCHPNTAEAVFDAIWAVGQPRGLQPLGLAALDMLRIESGLAFAGHEFDDQTDPFEAGIGFTVPLKNDVQFIGRPALEARKAAPQRKLVGLDITGNEVPSHGDCLRLGRVQVGVITSATRAPVLDKTIALARVFSEHSAPGTVLEVGQLDGHQKRLTATVVPFPHFDPTKSRAKGTYD